MCFNIESPIKRVSAFVYVLSLLDVDCWSFDEVGLLDWDAWESLFGRESKGSRLGLEWAVVNSCLCFALYSFNCFHTHRCCCFTAALSLVLVFTSACDIGEAELAGSSEIVSHSCWGFGHWPGWFTMVGDRLLGECHCLELGRGSISDQVGLNGLNRVCN